MMFWFLCATGLFCASALLAVAVGAMVKQSDEEQEAQDILDAIWSERQRQERRWLDLEAVSLTMEERR